MTRHDWMGKVIHLQLCKRLRFDHTDRWYMHKPESVLENGTDEILRDLEIQTDQQTQVRIPDLVLINKKKIICHCVDFAVLAGHEIKIKESEKINKY